MSLPQAPTLAASMSRTGMPFVGTVVVTKLAFAEPSPTARTTKTSPKCLLARNFHTLLTRGARPRPERSRDPNTSLNLDSDVISAPHDPPGRAGIRPRLRPH